MARHSSLRDFIASALIGVGFQQLHYKVGSRCGLIVLSLLLMQCKKAEDPVTNPQKPGTTIDTLRTGAKVLDKATYEALPLLKEPLVGARLRSDSKAPNLPAAYDLAANMPPVGDQGPEGSCTAWAVAYAARSYFGKIAKGLSYTTTDGKQNDESLFSPAFVYNQTNGGVDGGSTVTGALDLVQTKGVCTLKDMPYQAGNYKLQPTADQLQKAAAFKIKKWGRITIDAKTFKRFLYFDYPVLVAAGMDAINPLAASSKINGEYLWKSPKTTLSAFHAMVIVGFDDNRKAFKVQNSWSKAWGNQGYIWLDYESMPNVIIEAYVMITGESGPTPNVPAIQTNGYVFAGTTATLSGTIKELNNAAISRYGFQVADSKEALSSAPYQEVKVPITSVPYPFTLTYPTNGKSTYYYRAFAETPEEFWYGNTATLEQPVVVTKKPELLSRCGSPLLTSTQATLTGELTSLGSAASFADHGFILVQNSARQKDTNPTIANAPHVSKGPIATTGSFTSGVADLQASMNYVSYAYVKTAQGAEFTSADGATPTSCPYTTPPGITYSGNATVHSVGLPNQTINVGLYAYVQSSSTLVWSDYYAFYQWKEATKQATVLAGSGKAGLADGTGTAASFNDIWTITADAAGNVYLADNYKYTTGSGGNHQKIRKITPAGVVTSLAGNTSTTQTIPAFSDGKGEQASFRQIVSMTADAQGNLWVIDGTTVRKVTPDGTVTTWCGDPNSANYQDGSLTTARFYRPTVIAVDNAGTLFVVDKNSIRKITTSGVTTMAGQAVRDDAIEYISPGQTAIGTFPTAAHYTDGAAATADFFCPIAVLPDNNGNIYIVDRAATRRSTTGTFVRKLAANGQITTIAGKVLDTNNTVTEGGKAVSAPLLQVRGGFMGAGYIVLIDSNGNQYRLIQSL